jgi:hypothetical protein
VSSDQGAPGAIAAGKGDAFGLGAQRGPVNQRVAVAHEHGERDAQADIPSRARGFAHFLDRRHRAVQARVMRHHRRRPGAGGASERGHGGGLPAAPNEVGESGRVWSCALTSAGMASRRREGVRGEGPMAAIRASWKRMSTGPDGEPSAGSRVRPCRKHDLCPVHSHRGSQLTLTHAVQGSSLSF